ncbi:MAG: hypothetical protein OIN86_15045 [Candidatus Methanoperedens sp.]|nr:hypothetical protein [Candidatus Methanoperedens sp.]
MEIVDYILANDVHGVVLATHRLKRDGKPYEYKTAHIWRIRNGMFAEWWEYPRDLYLFDQVWS